MNAMTSVSTNMYRVSPRQAMELIPDVIEAGLVPFLKGSPGTAKSSIYHKIFKDYLLYMIDHRVSTSDPTEFTGLPNFVNGKARHQPFDELFPLEDTPIPEGYQGWGLFLDEFNHGLKATQNASYKLLLDRMTGQHKLHEAVAICLAGNLDTDRANVNVISTALKSRVVTMVLDWAGHEEEWIQDFAIPANIDPRIIAFISQYPSKLMEFDPASKDDSFSSPRTWEFMHKLIKDKKVVPEKAPLYVGTITPSTAVEFITYCEVFKDLPTLREILSDPMRCRIPQDSSSKWGTIATMMEKVDEKNFKGLSDYANRFDISFRILFYRSVLIRNPSLNDHPEFKKAKIALAKYLNS